MWKLKTHSINLVSSLHLLISVLHMHSTYFIIIGGIPLRHLVYRVLELPLSMQPLLYDFGQVAGKTEDGYITQIVTNHVCCSIVYYRNIGFMLSLWILKGIVKFLCCQVFRIYIHISIVGQWQQAVI